MVAAAVVAGEIVFCDFGFGFECGEFQTLEIKTDWISIATTNSKQMMR